MQLLMRYVPRPLVLNVFFARALVSRLPMIGAPVIVTLVEPGYCYSSLRRNLIGLQSLFNPVWQFLLARSTEVGSRQLICAALGFNDDEVQGQYIDTFAISEVADYVLERRDLEDRLWVRLDRATEAAGYADLLSTTSGRNACYSY